MRTQQTKCKTFVSIFPSTNWGDQKPTHWERKIKATNWVWHQGDSESDVVSASWSAQVSMIMYTIVRSQSCLSYHQWHSFVGAHQLRLDSPFHTPWTVQVFIEIHNSKTFNKEVLARIRAFNFSGFHVKLHGNVINHLLDVIIKHGHRWHLLSWRWG